LETGRDCIWIEFGPSWQLSEARVAIVLPVSIEDRLLLWMVDRHRLFIPSTYLLMGAGRLVTLLSWVSALFEPTVMGGLLGGGLSTALRPGLRCQGLGVPVWTGPGPLDRSETG
jgi:hypothetical protein